MTNSKELKFKELLLRRDYNKLKKEYIRCHIGAKSTMNHQIRPLKKV